MFRELYYIYIRQILLSSAALAELIKLKQFLGELDACLCPGLAPAPEPHQEEEEELAQIVSM